MLIVMSLEQITRNVLATACLISLLRVGIIMRHSVNLLGFSSVAQPNPERQWVNEKFHDPSR